MEYDWIAYRETIRQAAERGDIEFIEREIERNQLTQKDLERLARHHKPLDEWPEPDDDLMVWV
jgi:hypothetical protein